MSLAGDTRRILRGELRVLLKDPFALLLAVGLPLLMTPLLLGLGSRAEQAAVARQETEPLRVRSSPDLAAWLKEDDHIELVAEGALAGTAEAETASEIVHAIVVLPANGAGAIIRYAASSAQGRTASARLTAVLERGRRAEQDERWATAGSPIGPDELVQVRTVDGLSAEERDGLRLGRLLPALLVFLLGSASLYTALDLFAGEKERGTLETLLTTRVDRRAVVLGKGAVVLGFTLLVGLLGLLTLQIGLSYGLLAGAAGNGGGVLESVGVSGGLLGLSALLLVPLAGMVGAACILVASEARDYRHGQTLSLPLLIGLLALGGVAAWPGLSLGPLTALLPIGGPALALRDAAAGVLDPALGALATLAAFTEAAGLLWLARDRLGREAVLLGETGPGRRRAAHQYGADAALLYALVLVLFWFFGQLAQARDLVLGLIFTQVVLIGAPALLAPWWLGLPVRETLALRRPRGRDLGLALLAGLCAPGLGSLVARAQAPLLPTSSAILREFAAAFEIDLPLPVILLVFALLPAVCEELLFRGALLGLLRRSLAPLPRALVVGLLFGGLHMMLFRIVPTGALGVVLGLFALRGGSLALPIVIHALNNGLLLAGSELGWFSEDPPLAYQIVAVPLLGLCLWATGRGAEGRGPERSAQEASSPPSSTRV